MKGTINISITKVWTSIKCAIDSYFLILIFLCVLNIAFKNNAFAAADRSYFDSLDTICQLDRIGFDNLIDIRNPRVATQKQVIFDVKINNSIGTIINQFHDNGELDNIIMALRGGPIDLDSQEIDRKKLNDKSESYKDIKQLLIKHFGLPSFSLKSIEIKNTEELQISDSWLSPKRQVMVKYSMAVDDVVTMSFYGIVICN